MLNKIKDTFTKKILKNPTYIDVYGIPLWLFAREKFSQSFKFWDGVDELRQNVHNLSKLCKSGGELDLSKQGHTHIYTNISTLSLTQDGEQNLN